MQQLVKQIIALTYITFKISGFLKFFLKSSLNCLTVPCLFFPHCWFFSSFKSFSKQIDVLTNALKGITIKGLITLSEYPDLNYTLLDISCITLWRLITILWVLINFLGSVWIGANISELLHVRLADPTTKVFSLEFSKILGNTVLK